MDQDRVQAELAARRQDGAVLERLGGLEQHTSSLVGRGVSRPVRALLEEAFAAPPHMRSFVVSKHRAVIGEQFRDFTDADWTRAVAACLPQLAPSVESTLRILARRPYQQGLTRKPFRAPNAAATLADVRGRWLLDVTLLLGEYDADIRWVAERAAYLGARSGGTDLGWLLAGAIDVGGDTGRAVYDTLVASASGEHEAGRMGRHVTQALLSCARPDAWAFVERLLLAAQRQEGLRQAILECVDESHPEAFRRMLRLVLDEGLARFSAVVRAADSWFGVMWDGASAVKVDALLRRALLFLDDPAARAAALDEPGAESAYLALWCVAFEDVEAAVARASTLLASPSAEVRFVATHFLAQSLWPSAIPPLVDALADPDLRVATRALDMFGRDMTSVVDGERLFAQIERLLARVPKRAQTLDALVWPWWKRTLERPAVAAVLAANASAVPGERLLPYVPDLAPAERAAFLRRAAGLGRRWSAPTPVAERLTLSPSERAVALGLLGDASADVRAAAFDALGGLTVERDEADRLVDLLARRPGDLRNGALARLRTLPDAELLASADRLLADASDLRRLAGLELLRDAWEARRARDAVRTRVDQYAAAHERLTDPERLHVAAVLGDATTPATTDDALGLVDPATRRAWPAPRPRPVDVETAAARESVASLAELVTAHETTEVRMPRGETKLLLEALDWGFGPRRREDVANPEAADAAVPLAAVPLAAVWRRWLRERGGALRDADDMELLRAIVASDASAPWQSPAVQRLRGLGPWSAGTRFLRGLCEWCVAWEPPPNGLAFLLDGLENALAAFTDAECRELAATRTAAPVTVHVAGAKEPSYRPKLREADTWLRWTRWWRALFPASVRPAQAERLYGLLRAFEARARGAAALRPTLDDALGALGTDASGAEELADLLVGRWSYQPRSSLLRDASARKPPRGLADRPELLAVVDRCRRRVVEVETQRGDRETAASGLALELRWTGGLETVARAVPALGTTHFARTFGWAATGASRQETLSHLVLRSLPREEDTPEAFARWARDARVSEARLVELAVYAPQWAAHVNHVLQWPGLEDAVWWIQAHTRDDRSWQLAEVKEIWAAEVSERTPLSAADLTEGAVDVAWFARAFGALAFGALGPARWKALDAAAKYAASGAGHARAQLFARAMTGAVTRDEIVGRIDASRHQDSARALGLLPLGDGDDLLRRYERLEAFRREARAFGAQRRQSETRAAEIGLANLARTAGFRDPQRLQWAMEQRAVADLARGPLALARGDVTVTLSIDDDGVPALDVEKRGRPVKALPAALKKDAEVDALRHRLQELKRQRSRVREALEEAMCRGDRFEARELRTLLDHPLLAPSLARLVFVGDGVAGYLDEDGRVLRDHAGVVHVLGHTEQVRVAHPHDLFARGDWSAWQHECFRAERVQPFKQLFRELYPLTAGERGTSQTRRYAGHQVNPRQALALLGSRGWVARPEEGVTRTFHDDGLTARLGFQEAFYTPADIEGLTLEEVVFTRKGDWTPLSLDDVPPRLFSEAMRDLDLVVSVAHRGGVAPETTASTVEMRAALVRETCELLGLRNVELRPHHALVRGALGDYSVHLGSANVLVLPGTAVPIVAVHSQHRGRLFLPFADDDPRTAEVLSKVLLLARDREIRDPSILEWIRAARSGA